MNRFYSNGKLLLTAEYLVLDGAQALALPCKLGQFLEVAPVNDTGIFWTSTDYDGTTWLDYYFTTEQVTKKPGIAASEHERLLQILQVANQLNPKILQTSVGFSIKTHLTFPKNWGLGSSSTLVCNIANWFKIDPFHLLEKTFGGSGYDVACGLNNVPIIFERKNNICFSTAIDFKPDFKEHLFFVYLNKKQDSRQAISNYRARNLNNIKEQVTYFTELTHKIASSNHLLPFMALLEEHEDSMSDILGISPIKKQLFSDFSGVVKSLGGWGGDFILAACEEDPTAYFESKGYPVVIQYQNMIK